MWYQKSVREDMIKKIMDKLSASARKEREAERYAHDYAYGLTLERVKPGDERLVRSGIEYVNMKISQSKKK